MKNNKENDNKYERKQFHIEEKKIIDEMVILKNELEHMVLELAKKYDIEFDNKMLISEKYATLLERQKSIDIDVLKQLSILGKKYIIKKNELCEHNYKLVRTIALKKYRKFGGELDDYVQNGIVGLLIAIERFDVSKCSYFSTYATIYVSKYINEWLRISKNIIIKSERFNYEAYKCYRAVEYLQKKNFREPTIVEIANYTGLSLEKVNDIIINVQNNLSLSDKINDYDIQLQEALPLPNSDFEDSYLETDRIISKLKTLTDNELEIIQERYIKGNNQNNMARRLGINHNTLCMREKKLKKKLKVLLNENE